MIFKFIQIYKKKKRKYRAGDLHSPVSSETTLLDLKTTGCSVLDSISTVGLAVTRAGFSGINRNEHQSTTNPLERK